MEKPLTQVQREELDEAIKRARVAQKEIEGYSQERVDELAQALAWALANKTTFTQLSREGVDESGLGDREGRFNKRFKIKGILRDALREKSVGMVEEIPEKGIKKYAKPVGLIASVVPTTNPVLTPGGTGIYAIKARDTVIFSPHPRAKKTTYKAVEVLRQAMIEQGAPADVFQCLQNVNIPMTKALMAEADLVLATGGPGMVHSAYSSGTPAYGVGAGNSTMFIDETADVKEAAQNTRMSKTSDFGSGCSADGNLVIDSRVYDEMVEALIAEGAYLANTEERAKLKKAMWDDEGHRRVETVAVSPQKLCREAGFEIPEDRKFVMVVGEGIGKEHLFSNEKLTTLLALYKYEGFENGLQMIKEIYDVKGKGHSCGIYSHNDDHIHELAMLAPVSRMMVRQPQSKANAGSFTNGMPMTSSLGCGTWGGNVTNENVNLKHYLNYTWVSEPIAEDRPSDEELFGKFYNPELEK